MNYVTSSASSIHIEFSNVYINRMDVNQEGQYNNLTVSSSKLLPYIRIST